MKTKRRFEKIYFAGHSEMAIDKKNIKILLKKILKVLSKKVKDIN